MRSFEHTENSWTDAASVPDFAASGLVGASPAFLKQLSRLPIFAACDAGVLIIGETGTGKEVCGRAIHALSARARRPWVAVNCGAIPSDLVENELFGHVRGAYTTAHTSHDGLVHEAESGTLFLDEVDCLGLAAQVKLLRFLEEKQYRPIGSARSLSTDVRVIAASNQDLAGLTALGRFRQDLYFRLNVLALYIPPLRERLDDIPLLAQHFTRRFAAQYQRSVTGVTIDAMRVLLRYPWPGNVRELKNAIERAVLLARGAMLELADIELPVADGCPNDESFREAKARVVGHFERTYLENLLSTHAGNITQAALSAKKNRRAFFHLLKKHHVEAARFRQH